MFLNIETRKSHGFGQESQTKHLQFGELQKEVTQLAQQNRKKYMEVIEYRPRFDYQLIKVSENRSISLNFGKELLMKQMDRLMEEESFLNKELTLIGMEL